MLLLLVAHNIHDNELGFAILSDQHRLTALRDVFDDLGSMALEVADGLDLVEYFIGASPSGIDRTNYSLNSVLSPGVLIILLPSKRGETPTAADQVVGVLLVKALRAINSLWRQSSLQPMPLKLAYTREMICSYQIHW